MEGDQSINQDTMLLRAIPLEEIHPCLEMVGIVIYFADQQERDKFDALNLNVEPIMIER